MKASKLKDQAGENSRLYEIALREAENKASGITQQSMAATRKASQALQVIVGARLQHGIMLSNDIEAMLDKRTKRENQLKLELGNVEQGIQDKQASLAKLKAELAGLKTKAEAALKANPEYMSLDIEGQKAAAAMRDAELTTVEIISECKLKLTVYDENRLFNYLVVANYGEPEYTGAGLVRHLDGWIATLCNFEVNRKNQQLLRQLLDAGKNMAANARSRFEALHGQIEALCVKVDAELEIPATLKSIELTKKAISEAKQRANHLHDSLAEFANRTDPEYRNIQDTLQAIVKDESIEDMIAAARKTSTTDDDEVVNAFHMAQREIATLQERSREAMDAVAAAKRQYERAKDLERSVRNINSSRYEFRSGLDFDSIVTDYMEGKLTNNTAMEQVNEYRRAIPQDDYYDNSRSSSSNWGSGSSWGSSSKSDDSWSSSSSSSSSFGSSSSSSSDSFGGSSSSTSDSF